MAATGLGGFLALQGLWAVPWLMAVDGHSREVAAFHLLLTTIAMVCGFLATALFIGPLQRRGVHLQKLVREIPLERLLVETDAPYLLPRNLDPKPRTRRNEPRYLPHIVAEIARHRGESVATIAEATTCNASRLFGWPTLT